MAKRELPVHRYNQTKVRGGEVKHNWWDQKEDTLHEHMFGVIRRIKSNQSYRESKDLCHARIYGNKEINGLMAHQFNRSAADFDNRISLNVTKSAIDTVSSNLATNKTRPLFLTDEGDWTTRRRAEKLTRYMDGWFDEQKIYQLVGNRSLPVQGTFGTRVAKLYIEDSKVKAEQTLPFEIIVDEVEGIYGRPHQMFQERNLYRDVLIEKFPKHKALIEHCPGVEGDGGTSDMITIAEGWKLSPNGKGGTHAICLESVTLLKEDWDKPFFPFVFGRWSTPFLGFYGEGIAEELIPLQIEINKVLRTIQHGQHLMCVPQVWLEHQSKVATGQISNQMGGVRYYIGNQPLFLTPSAFPPEIYSHLWNLYQRAYDIVGVSQLSAAAQKPAGIQANSALRTLQDIESKRFMIAEEDNQQFYMDIAELAIEFTADIYEKDKKLSVKTRSRSFMEEIKWAEVRIEKNKYLMRSYPTNFLPSHPSGQLEKAQEAINAGFLGMEEALSLLDFPDVRSVTSRKTAPLEIIEKLIDRILDGKDYEAPDSYFNVRLAKEVAQMSYLKAKSGNAPEGVLENLRTLVDDCTDLVNKEKEAAMPQMGDPMMAQPPAQMMDPSVMSA